VAALREAELGELIFVPDVMMKEGEGVFLDDLTVEDLERELGRPVVVVEATPFGIYQALEEATG
jgi:NifB/MoaA-like Fe-S oxidoreductase